jgi:hypothetical protein
LQVLVGKRRLEFTKIDEIDEKPSVFCGNFHFVDAQAVDKLVGKIGQAQHFDALHLAEHCRSLANPCLDSSVPLDSSGLHRRRDDAAANNAH